MASKEKFKGYIVREAQAVLFDSAEEAWFWFIMAQQARNDGAKAVSGASTIPRPCEAVDILKILDSLYRQRRLMREHFLVLRHYGRRNMPPDPRRLKEARAFVLWREAMEKLTLVFIEKGIVREKKWADLKKDAAGRIGLFDYGIFENGTSEDDERMAAE